MFILFQQERRTHIHLRILIRSIFMRILIREFNVYSLRHYSFLKTKI
jgi:hypothetical protein